MQMWLGSGSRRRKTYDLGRNARHVDRIGPLLSLDAGVVARECMLSAKRREDHIAVSGERPIRIEIPTIEVAQRIFVLRCVLDVPPLILRSDGGNVDVPLIVAIRPLRSL